MTKIIRIESCNDCPDRQHTGAFSDGGARAICHNRKRLDETDYDTESRIIEDPKKIPAWCPLEDA